MVKCESRISGFCKKNVLIKKIKYSDKKKVCENCYNKIRRKNKQKEYLRKKYGEEKT